ncbi:MAG: lysophospholipid acyltransferase family protein, partial [Stellaceae bacterium]
MSAIKRFGRSEGLHRVLCRSIVQYIRLVKATNNWSVEGAEHIDRLHKTNVPHIGAFWHGRLLMMPYGWARVMPVAMLISPHPDGRIISDAVRQFGIDIISGSTNRGASEAVRSLVRALQKGSCVAITPDGPDGPAMTATAGIVQVARIAGAPIVPITYATSRRVILKTWDRFHLP